MSLCKKQFSQDARIGTATVENRAASLNWTLFRHSSGHLRSIASVIKDDCFDEKVSICQFAVYASRESAKPVGQKNLQLCASNQPYCIWELNNFEIHIEIHKKYIINQALVTEIFIFDQTTNWSRRAFMDSKTSGKIGEDQKDCPLKSHQHPPPSSPCPGEGGRRTKIGEMEGRSRKTEERKRRKERRRKKREVGRRKRGGTNI